MQGQPGINSPYSGYIGPDLEEGEVEGSGPSIQYSGQHQMPAPPGPHVIPPFLAPPGGLAPATRPRSPASLEPLRVPRFECELLRDGKFSVCDSKGYRHSGHLPWLPENQGGGSNWNTILGLVVFMRRRADFMQAYMRIPSERRPALPQVLFNLLVLAERCEKAGVAKLSYEDVRATCNGLRKHYGHVLESSQSGGGSEPQPNVPVYAVLGACTPLDPKRELAGSALAQYYFGMAFKVNTWCSEYGTRACAYTRDMIEADWVYPVCIPLLEDGKDLPTLIAEEMRERTPAGMKLVNAMNQSIHDYHAAHKGNGCHSGSDNIDIAIDTSSTFLLIEVENLGTHNLDAARSKGDGLKGFTYEGQQYELLAVLYTHDHDIQGGGAITHSCMDVKSGEGKQVIRYDDLLAKEHVRRTNDWRFILHTRKTENCRVMALMYVRKS